MAAVIPTTDLSTAVNRLLDSREAQGLDRHVSDPAALAAIATVLRSVAIREKAR